MVQQNAHRQAEMMICVCLIAVGPTFLNSMSHRVPRIGPESEYRNQSYLPKSYGCREQNIRAHGVHTTHTHAHI